MFGYGKPWACCKVCPQNLKFSFCLKNYNIPNVFKEIKRALKVLKIKKNYQKWPYWKGGGEGKWWKKAKQAFRKDKLVIKF